MKKETKLFIIMLLIILYLLNKDLKSNNIKNKEGFQQTSFTSGMIIIWNGTLSNIPSGWVLCDGNNGTPDLRGRFVLGVNSNTNRSIVANQIEEIRELRTTGGEEKHILTISEMPSHNHPASKLRDNNNTCNCGGGGCACSVDWNNSTGNTGYSQPHNNMPPYYVLAYIMKT